MAQNLLGYHTKSSSWRILVILDDRYASDRSIHRHPRSTSQYQIRKLPMSMLLDTNYCGIGKNNDTMRNRKRERPENDKYCISP